MRWKMQSLTSLLRPSVSRHYGCHLRKNISVPHHRRGVGSSLSSGTGRSIKLCSFRKFSEKGRSAVASSPIKARSSFFVWYSKKLDTNPIITKCVSAGLVSSIGSTLAQVIAHEQAKKEHIDGDDDNKRVQDPFEIDLERVSRFVLLNIVYVAPVLHYWYEYVNRALPGRSFSRVLQRTFCDEFLFSPIYIPVLLGILWKSEGKTNEKIWSMIKSELPTILVTEWVSNTTKIALVSNSVVSTPIRCLTSYLSLQHM